MSEEWNDVEINHLTDALESMRKKGHTLGLYGLNDQQATWIHKQHLPTKSIRQIKRFILKLFSISIRFQITLLSQIKSPFMNSDSD